jgi:hypothetical protein
VAAGFAVMASVDHVTGKEHNFPDLSFLHFFAFFAPSLKVPP